MNEIVTTAVSEMPAVTENGFDIFFYDVSQANQHQANWWNSVSNHFNNIIDAVKSCGLYMAHIVQVAAVFVSENTMPIVLGQAIGISLFFLWLDFLRGR